MSLIPKKFPYEVFLAHAVADRQEIVTELYDRLQAAGIKIWYSGNSLSTGNVLDDEVKKAIRKSRYGVTVFTRISIERDWPNTELAWLRSREEKTQKVILPVLHKITAEEIAPKYPGIAAKYCILSSRGMDFVIEKILEEVIDYRRQKRSRDILQWLILSIIAFALIILFYLRVTDRPTEAQITNTIKDRIETLKNTINSKYTSPFISHSSIVNQNKIDSARLAYQNFKSYYRNEYEFYDGITTIRGRTNCENIIGRNPADLGNSQGYGMDSVDIYWSAPEIIDGFRHSSFSLINKRSIQFCYKTSRENDLYLVKVYYNYGLQYINVSLTTPPTSAGTRRHEMTIVGLPPSETYYFEKGTDDEWHFKEVQ